VRLLRDSSPGRPALDIALSNALLARVARGELGPTVRLYRPGPTLAFGRLDALRPGFAEAGEAARDAGFEPIVRLAGGHAAAYHEQSLIYEEITCESDATAGLHDRFRDTAAVLADALDGFGVDARVGEIPGEYCAGAYTVSSAGRLKLAGTAQRVVRGGALVSAFVLVGGGERLRAALFDVYRALELAWDPATAGALDDVVPSVSVTAVEEAILAVRGRDHALVPAAVDERTLALARELEARHRWPIAA
jgi:octanoyl-[GcvH]:protein N-octanoyltransferase